MAEGNERAFGETQTLQHLLEFLSKLHESSVKTNVIKKLRKEVEKYITNNLTDFADEEDASGYLPQTIDKSKELRSNIVATDGTYKYYNTQFNDSDAVQCVKHLIDNIFPVFGCLYYMYYECSGECSYIEGGEWYNERCAETGKNLNKWLKDETQKVKAPDKNGSLMIERGFKQDDLSDNDGKALFPGGSSTTALLYFNDGAQLQYCLYYMLFLPDDENWDNAQSGHAVLFLQALCKMVSGDQFKDMYVDKDGGSFKTACQKVEQKISTLIQSNTIVPVAHEYKTVTYADLLERKHFWKYIGWLIKNLSRLMASLKDMESDYQHWNQESLKKSNTFGPFPWGFVFKANWTSGGGLQEKLKEALSELITELQTFQRALDKIEPVSSSAATVGGVLGGLGTLGAAGAAGAAAAYSGLLGPVAEGIGRFFKGLIL